MLQILLTTIINRPYVLVFLISFLIIGISKIGFTRTLFYLFWGYLVAWISEALSIRYGFPYGQYFYIYENLKGEWLNWGVPVWDSASYTFLTFAGYGLAESIFGGKKKLKLVLWAALFVTLLDIVVDPLAHRGDEWFLGQIYYYAHPGYYFNVPLSNFIGWYIVAFIIIGGFVFTSKISTTDLEVTSSSKKALVAKHGPIVLYFGIFLFNWVITLWIGQYLLALFDLFWMSLPFYLFLREQRK